MGAREHRCFWRQQRLRNNLGKIVIRAGQRCLIAYDTQGESSGSFAVGQLVLTYGGRTDGLFHRSIQESGSASTAWCNSSAWYEPIYNKIVEQTKCTNAINTLECLRTRSYKTIYPFLNPNKIAGPGWYPVRKRITRQPCGVSL